MSPPTGKENDQETVLGLSPAVGEVTRQAQSQRERASRDQTFPPTPKALPKNESEEKRSIERARERVVQITNRRRGGDGDMAGGGNTDEEGWRRSGIEVSALQFGYDGQPPLFARFNLRIAPGSRCLLVGANGSGIPDPSPHS